MTEPATILQPIEKESKRIEEEQQELEKNHHSNPDSYFQKLFKHSLDLFQKICQELLKNENTYWLEQIKYILTLEFLVDTRDLFYLFFGDLEPDQIEAYKASFEGRHKHRMKLENTISTLNKYKEIIKNRMINLLPFFVLTKTVDDTHYFSTDTALIVAEYAVELPTVHGDVELDVAQLVKLHRSFLTLPASFQIGTWKDEQSEHSEPFLLSDPITMGKCDGDLELWQLVDQKEFELSQIEPTRNKVFNQSNGRKSDMSTNLTVIYKSAETLEELGKLQEAIAIYQTLSTDGYAPAQYRLAFSYLFGKGLPKNDERAIELFQQVLKNGIQEAHYQKEALHQLALLNARPVNEDQRREFGRIQYEMAAIDLKRGEEVRNLFLEDSVKNGYAPAQDALARLYERGRNVEQDFNAAFKLYQDAAKQGYAKAIFNVGRCYQYGKGVTLDHKRALECYQQAAEQGLVEAQISLGYCYEFGLLVDSDLKQAVEYYKKASKGDFLAYERVKVLEQVLKGASSWILFERRFELQERVEEELLQGKSWEEIQQANRVILFSDASKMTKENQDSDEEEYDFVDRLPSSGKKEMPGF